MKIHEVRQMRANGFGLYDMLGNVWEWVNDWYDQNYYDNSPSQDPTGPTVGVFRVIRGGAWNYYPPRLVRVSRREWFLPANASTSGGFRCGGEVFPPSAHVASPASGTAVPAGQKPRVEAPVAEKEPDLEALGAVPVTAPGKELGPVPTRVRVNPKDGLKYAWIPPGTFMMGCSLADNGCASWEKPQHQVTITRGVWMGQTEVTVGAYKRFAASGGREMPSPPSFNNKWASNNMPIVNVSWFDAQAYCGWAGGRLPTEAEWEYAARGGSTEARYGPVDEIAWYDQNSGLQAHNVAEKRPNAFGLYDMLGNVWEWVSDWYDENYYEGSPSENPAGPTSGQDRVLWGDGENDSAGSIRVSERIMNIPTFHSNNLGFRCGRGVNP
jgi:formylglycine-generating enzyme required for sulfatase activity